MTDTNPHASAVPTDQQIADFAWERFPDVKDADGFRVDLGKTRYGFITGYKMALSAAGVPALVEENRRLREALVGIMAVPAVRQILGTRHTDNCDCPWCVAEAAIATKLAASDAEGV